MGKKRIIDLPETKGEFKARGLVVGTTKDKFFQSKKTKTNKNRLLLKFGLKFENDGSTVYCDLSAQEQDKVYFYKKGDKKNNIPGVTQDVVFGNRDKFKSEGFEPIGIKVGIEQEVDDKGKIRNKNIPMFEYDAIPYLHKNLKEEMGAFVRGKIEFSSFVNGLTGDKVRMTKLVPSQISGVTSDLDLNNNEYVAVNDFIQTIIFMGLEMDESDKEDKKGILSAKIVNYSSIEDAEFIIRDVKIFKTFKKNLKPYNAIKVFGKIHNKLEIEEVEDDGWGSESNSFEKKGNSFTRELLILGADPSTLDTDTYTKQNVEEAIETIKANNKAKEEFGDSGHGDDTWGENIDNNQSEEEFDDGWA